MTARSRIRLGALAAAAALLALVAGDALAQQRVPYRERPDGDRRQQRTYEPGVFDYYALALSWSPSYCAGLTDGRYDPQCHSNDGRRYAFVLHGLWPQFEQRWPQFCQSPDNGFVPKPVAERMLDIMPSQKLVFHEYRKHGTCSGLSMDDYFALARRTFEAVKIPKRYVALDNDRLFVGVDELKREFMAVNPSLRPEMFVVECGGPGPRLKEVRICLDKAGAPRACGRNEDQARLCSAERIYVPPVRAGGTTSVRPEREQRSQRLPRPVERPATTAKDGDTLLPGPR